VPFELDLEPAPEEPCPYLPDRAMRVRGFACAEVPGYAYQDLLDAGFRRSGLIYYQPMCRDCRACVPLRVPVASFVTSRSQRRVLRRNRDLSLSWAEPALSDEKLAIYQRYLEARHDRIMDRGREGVERFLYSSSTDTIEGEYRDATGRLVGVAICDVTPEALSSVYFYHEPAEAERSLGTFSALCEITRARETGRAHYYLGYWIAACAKMAYKDRFRPCQTLDGDGVWRTLAELQQDETREGDEFQSLP